MKANNYEHCVAKLNEMQPGLGNTLNPEIKPANKNYYQVVLVRKTNDVKRERYITTFHVQSFNARSFEKLQKGFVFIGYNTFFVLHDPTKQEAPTAPAPAPEPTPEPKPEPVFDVNTARVAELREFAEDHNIELAEEDLKADIKKKIKAWQESQTTEV